MQTVSRNWRIYEVETDDNDHLQVMSDARLKLAKDLAPVMPCIGREYRQGQPLADNALPNVRTGLSVSENTGACGSVKRKHEDHIAKEKGQEFNKTCHFGTQRKGQANGSSLPNFF